ncbi:MAG: extracellular solute-binding protein, partial [Chloroflexia bacterium]
MQGPRKNLSRRRFLELTGASLGMATLAACGSTPPPSGSSNPTQAPAPPAAAGGTATAAPAPPAAAPEPTPGIRQAASGRDTIIEVWYPYGGTASTTLQQYWEAYEKQNTKVGIKAVYAANDLSTNAKLFTAIASGRPPDVSWVDGPQVAEWAARNALEPLDARIAQSGFGEDDFWAPSWEQ